MKHKSTLVPVLMVLVLMLCCGAAAAERGTHGQLNWSLDGAGTLVITGSGPMQGLPWDSTDAWLAYSKRIRKIVIGDGITSVGNTVFQGCDQITQVQLPASIMTIGDGAFAFCRSLTGIALPPHLGSIGMEAFRGCASLTGMEFPESLKTIEVSAFAGCESLTNIRIPSGVKTVKLSVFNGCKNLRSVVFPEGLEAIWGYAFCGCTQLTQVSIPAGVTDFSPMAFAGCVCLEEILVAEGNPKYISFAGGVYSKDGTRVITYPNGKKNIVIPEGVITIGEFAFYQDTNLTKISFPGTLATIETNAFCGCTGLTEISWSEGLETISDAAFYECTKLKETVLPNSLKIIGKNAFYGCTSLNTAWIPKTAKLQSGSLTNCDSLRDIYYAGTMTEWYDAVVGEIQKGVYIHILNVPTPGRLLKLPAGLQRLGAEALADLGTGIGIEFPSGAYLVGPDDLLARADKIPSNIGIVDEDVFEGSDITLILTNGVSAGTWLYGWTNPIILVTR